MKPGYKTTEFWITVAAVAAAAVGPVFAPAIDAEAQRAIARTGQLAPLAAAAYVAARGWVKGKVAAAAARPAEIGR